MSGVAAKVGVYVADQTVDVSVPCAPVENDVEPAHVPLTTAEREFFRALMRMELQKWPSR